MAIRKDNYHGNIAKGSVNVAIW